MPTEMWAVSLVRYGWSLVRSGWSLFRCGWSLVTHRLMLVRYGWSLVRSGCNFTEMSAVEPGEIWVESSENDVVQMTTEMWAVAIGEIWTGLVRGA